jgi:hypothetical protein
MNVEFPWADFLINIVTFAVVPGLLAAYGGYLAAEAIQDVKRSRRVKRYFWFLFAAGVITTAWQQYRVVLTEQGKPNSSVAALKEAFPWLSKQPQPQSQPQPKPLPAGSSGRFANITNERLHELLKSNVSDLAHWENQWRSQESTMASIITELGNPRLAPAGVTNQERLNSLKTWEEKKANLRDSVVKPDESKSIVSTAFDLQNEITTNRLRSWNLAGILPLNQRADALFAKLKSSKYERDDLRKVLDYMTELQKRFEAAIK